MKNYTDSDYALNKVNNDAIVYRFVDGIVQVTLVDYLSANPDKTEADFRALKELSDGDYLEQDRSDYRQTRKNVPIHGLEETDICADSSPEDAVIDQPEQAAMKKKRRDMGLRALETLTEIQRRRYLQYHVEGLSSWKIAQLEGANQKTVYESLQAAERKIKKNLTKG